MKPTVTSFVASLYLFAAATLPVAHGAAPSSVVDGGGRIVVHEASGAFATTAEQLTTLLMAADTDIVLVEAFRVEGLTGTLSPNDAKTIWDWLDDHQDIEGIEASTIRDFKSDFIGGLTDAQMNDADKQAAKTLLGRLLGEVPVGSFSTGSPVFGVVRSIQYETDPATLVFKRSVSYMAVDLLTGRGLNVYIVRATVTGSYSPNEVRPVSSMAERGNAPVWCLPEQRTRSGSTIRRSQVGANALETRADDHLASVRQLFGATRSVHANKWNPHLDGLVSNIRSSLTALGNMLVQTEISKDTVLRDMDRLLGRLSHLAELAEPYGTGFCDAVHTIRSIVGSARDLWKRVDLGNGEGVQKTLRAVIERLNQAKRHVDGLSYWM